MVTVDYIRECNKRKANRTQTHTRVCTYRHSVGSLGMVSGDKKLTNLRGRMMTGDENGCMRGVLANYFPVFDMFSIRNFGEPGLRCE